MKTQDIFYQFYTTPNNNCYYGQAIHEPTGIAVEGKSLNRQELETFLDTEMTKELNKVS